MRILMWDVHGGYTDSMVAGAHEDVSCHLTGRGMAGSPVMATYRPAPRTR